MPAYDAFISYSHTADSTLAAALQSALHRFAKPWYKTRAVHIFRDQTNLAVNPALWSNIREALDQSSFFILLTSPEAAASPWVAKEAEHWITKNGVSHFLIVLTGGSLKWDSSYGAFASDQTTALPAPLLHSFQEEPLYLDLCWARSDPAGLRMSDPRFHEAVLQLASTLHNKPKDELDSADIRFQRHARWWAASALVTILLAALIALRQTRESHSESLQNVAARLAATSAKVLTDNPDQAREAALLAIESNRLSPSFEANQALRAAVSVLPASAQFYPPEDSDPTERVRDIAFSPDGATLAVTRDNGSTQLLDLANRKPLGYFTPDSEPAARIVLPADSQDAALDDPTVSVTFNHSGSLLATGSRDGSAHIWALPSGRELLRIVHGVPVSQVSFRSSTNELATATEDGHVRIFDVDRAVVLADFKCSGEVTSAAFSPDGGLLAALSSEGGVSLFDPVHHQLLRTLAGGDAAFNLAFSRDGSRLATASGDFAFVWDIASGRKLLDATHSASSETLSTQQWIVQAAISPDGKFLAYAARGDDLARVWAVETGRQILGLKHDSSVAAVAFNADGTKLGTGSYDGTARVWELPSGREVERISLAGGAEVVNFGPGANRFAAGGMGGSVSVSEARRADRPAAFDLPGPSRTVAFSPDGRRLAIGTVSHAGSLVRIGDTAGKILGDFEIHGIPVVDKLFFVDANRVIAQWSDKLFLITIDRTSVSPLPDIRGEKRIDPSGNVLAIQQDGVSRLYSLPGLQHVASVAGPHSGLLRTAGQGRLVAFEMSRPPDHWFIDIWSVARQASICHIPLPAELNRVAFSTSGTTVFTAESENLQVWDLPSAKLRLSIKSSGDIDLIVPSPAADAFATITHGRLSIWDSRTGARLAQLPDTGYLRAAAFSADGRYLLAGYDERLAALWLWRADDLREQACGRLTRNLSHEDWNRWLPGRSYHPSCPNLPAGN